MPITVMASSLALLALSMLLILSFSGAETETHLHFYLHDTVSGSDPIAARMASGQSESPSIMMIDDLLTEQPHPGSRMVGRAQGMYALTSKAESWSGLLVVMNLVFPKYNGSTIAVLGRNNVTADEREMAVVGGSGYFRLARGYALAKTNQLDKLGRHATVEYDVHVLHQ